MKSETHKNLIIDFSQKGIVPTTEILGGKGLSLFGMTKNGLNVPDSFVINASVFNLSLKRVV